MHVHALRSRFLRIALRILAIVALTLPLAPQVSTSADDVAPQINDCPESVRISGPADGSTNTYYSFTATVSPQVTYQSLRITWVVDGVEQMTDSANPSLQEFQWSLGGHKTISAKVNADQFPSGTRCSEVLATPREVTISPMPISEVPLASYRLAAQLLEEQRAVTPNWADASFYAPSGDDSAGAVTPLYRPDIPSDPAYYEFRVFGPDDDETRERGFIIVSTGDHDHPITNWSTGGWSPTRRMRTESGWTADKFYKLDVLSYVAEDKDGAWIPAASNPPPKVTLPADWATTPPPLVTTNWVPTLMEGLDDPIDGSETITYTQTITPTVDGELKLDPWDSWAALKAGSGYATNYAPFIAALAQSAAPEWEALDIQSEHGYVLHKGESVSFPLLLPVTNLVYEGDAYDLSLVTVQQPAEGDPHKALLFTAVEDVFSQGVPMTATVTYNTGAVETIKVMVVSEPKYWVYLPLVVRGGATAGAGPAGAGAAAQAPVAQTVLPAGEVAPQTYTPGTLAADGYTYWYVGATEAQADAQQAWYDQFDSTGCKSGCGPTAWAMYIAWGDMRAHEGTNWNWAGRTGLYREGGGRGDPAAIAPTSMDDGVKFMIEQIRLHVVTFCNAFNDSGATLPATMHMVSNYINGRSAVNVRTWYLPAGFSVTGADGDTVRSAARNILQNEGDTRRPTVIGTGFFSHYPLAYGYRSKTQQTCTTTFSCPPGGCKWVTNCTTVLLKGFYVNQGWGDGTGEWVSTDIFFNGRLSPHISGANDIGFYRSSDDTFRFDTNHDFKDMFYFRYPAGTLPYAVRPVVGDFDRDGVVDDLAHVVRSDYWDSSKRDDWYIDIDTNNSIEHTLDKPVFNPGGWPVVLDHDRDGFVDDIALFSPDRFSYAYMCHDDGTCQGYPTGGDYVLPVTGDFDRDGFHDDIAFYTPAERTWVFDMDHDHLNLEGGPAWPAGAGDNALPIAGDFDEDGVADDIGLLDPGYQKWWFDYNHTGDTDDSGTGFGMAGDLPFVGNFWNN